MLRTEPSCSHQKHQKHHICCCLGYEQQGNVTNAIEHQEKFLDLWKDADPGIAQVEDMKKRVTLVQKPIQKENANRRKAVKQNENNK